MKFYFYNTLTSFSASLQEDSSPCSRYIFKPFIKGHLKSKVSSPTLVIPYRYLCTNRGSSEMLWLALKQLQCTTDLER